MNQKTLLWVVVGVVVLGGLMFLMDSTPTSAPGGDIEIEDADEPGDVDDIDADGAEADDDDADADAIVIDLTGQNFAFSQDEIRVDVGDTVTVNFTSVMGLHDFVVDGLDVATEQVNAGGTTSVTFTVTEAGAFEYYCSVGMHRALGMTGMLIVE